MEKIIRKLDEIDLKIYYKKVFWNVVVIHLFACLFISGNIFFILLAMLGSLVVIKIVELSISFIFTIPFVTEGERRKIKEENIYSLKMAMYNKSVKVKYTQAIVFSTALIFIPLKDLGMIYDYLIKTISSCLAIEMIFNSIFLGFGLGGLRAICYKIIE